MQTTFTCALIVAIAAADKFSDFTSAQGKSYNSVAEYNRRKGLWEKNHKVVEEMNERNAGRSVKFSDNFTSDLTDDEYKNMLGLKPPSEGGARLLHSEDDHKRHL